MKISDIKFPFIVHNEYSYNGRNSELTFSKKGTRYYVKTILFTHKMSGLEQHIVITNNQSNAVTAKTAFNYALNNSKDYKMGPFSSKFKRNRIKLIFNARKITFRQE